MVTLEFFWPGSWCSCILMTNVWEKTDYEREEVGEGG